MAENSAEKLEKILRQLNSGEDPAKVKAEDLKASLPLGHVVHTLMRDHIFKENNILYPTAVEIIDDESVWEQMHHDADKIGYCCFTPRE